MNEDNKYINIKDVAEAKGLTSTRSIRLELNKIESKYISREIKVNGGTSYEILFSSLEPEIQRKLREAENKTTSLVPHNYKEPDFVSDKTKLTANYRANIVVALQKLRKKYPTKKEADTTFLELYNSGLYLPSEAIIGIRDKVNIRYSLFDLSKIHVYSTKGEFLCIAHRVPRTLAIG